MEEKKSYIKVTAYFLLINLIVRVPGVVRNTMPWISDELGVWMTASWFGGYADSWKAYINDSGSVMGYYGFIASLVYAPIICLLKNIKIVYTLCILVKAILIAIMGVIAFSILHKYLKTDIKTAVIISTLSSMNYTTLHHANTIMTETVFTLWVWIVFLLVVKSLYSSNLYKPKVINTILFAVIIAAGYGIHSRCLVVWGMLLIIYLIYLALKKKQLVNLFVFAPVFVFTYVCLSSVSNAIQGSFWNTSGVTNSTE